MGDCEIGYSGILCSECVPGYSSSGNFKCGVCPKNSLNAVRLLFILLGCLIGVGWLIK